jgi:hypothetical protein
MGLPVYLEAEPGADGESGPPGAAGAQGVQGITGAQGVMGLPVYLEAEPGADGDPGPPGVNGTNGTTGAQGPIGPAVFLDADAGADGDMGPPGPPGPSPISQGLDAIAQQGITAATLTNIVGGNVPVPPSGFVVRQAYRWRVMLTKTGAGTAASSFFIKIGTTGTTADATVATFATGLGTAVIDTGWIDIELVVRTIGAAATAMACFRMGHNLAATGWLVIPDAVILGTMATWNSTIAVQIVSLAVTTGAAVAPTVQMCYGVCVNQT